jgi:hypothetical protein
MEPSPSWEPDENLPNTLWNRKIPYPANNVPALVPILNQISPVHITPQMLVRPTVNYSKNNKEYMNMAKAGGQ